MGLFAPNVEKLKEKGDVNGLVKALGYRDSALVRDKAAQALGELGGPRAVDALITVLNAADPDVCRAAIEALGKIRDERAIKPLVALLREKRPEIRDSVTGALAVFGSPAVKPLLELLKDNDPKVRLTAMDVIVAIGAPAVETLCSLLKNTDGLKGSLVAEALGRIGDKRALGALVAALKNKSKEIRSSAAKALGMIGDAGAVQGLLEAMGDKEISVRDSTAEALQKLGWNPGKDSTGARYLILKQDWDKCAEIGAPAVEPLIQFIQEEPYATVATLKAAEALEKIRDPEAVPLLIDALEHRKDEVRSAAAGALGAMRVTQAIDQLAFLMGDNVSSVGKAAAAALLRIGGDPVQQALLPMLEDTSEKRRAQAAHVLEQLGWKPSSQEAEVKFLIGKGDWDGCIRLGTPAVAPLAALLQEEHDSASASAAMTLGRIGDPAATDALAAALSDKRSTVSKAAEEALVMLGTPAIGPVQDLLCSGQRVLRERAADLLDRLGWQPQTDEEKAWYWSSKKAWKDCETLRGSAVEPLLLGLEDKDEKLRLAAIETLGNIGDARAVEALIRSLSDPYTMVQLASVRALGMIGDPRAVVSLLRALRDFDEVEQKLVALHALGVIGDESAAQGLLELIQDEDQDEAVMNAAGTALEKIGWKARSAEEQVWFLISTGKWDELVTLGQGAVDTLRLALKSYWRIPGCGQAVEVLGRIGVANTVELLIQYLTLENFEMRQGAACALVHLYRGGKITEEEKQVVLQQREFIEKAHVDSPGHGDRVGCIFINHHDRGGAEIAFPL